MPPRVDCSAGPAEKVPPIPVDDEGVAQWIGKMLGLYEGEVSKRVREHGCLDELREKGVIR